MHPRNPIRLNITTMLQWSQNLGVRGEGPKVTAYSRKGRTKSSGVKPKEPITAFMSPKNGSAAEMKVASTTYDDRKRIRGTRLRMENFPSFTSEE